jgi:hypothetical protein
MDLQNAVTKLTFRDYNETWKKVYEAILTDKKLSDLHAKWEKAEKRESV